MSSTTTVMGIDTSTTGFAFCILEDGKAVKWGKINFEGKAVFDRLVDGQNKLRAVSDQFQVDYLFFEAAAYVQNKKTVILLAMALGAIIPSIVKPGVVIYDLPPITWQAAIGNKPFTKAEKEQLKKDYPDKSDSWRQGEIRKIRKNRTRQWVNDNLGFDSDIDDVTDAAAIAYVGWSKISGQV